MKAIALLAFVLAATPALALNSFPVEGPRADALVNALVALGLDPVGTHEFLQAGITVCNEIYDDTGTHFENGQIGDYIGEECLVYGDAYESDPDGALRLQELLPASDRYLDHHPELREKLLKLRNLRFALEALVIPVVKTVQVGGKDIVTSRMTGIVGTACEGHLPSGARLCSVKPSERCLPRD